MAKNLVSNRILAPSTQIWAPKFFFVDLTLLDVKHCCKLSLHAISRKTNEPNLRKRQKPSFGTNFDPFDPNSGCQFFFFFPFFFFFFFFFKNMAFSVTRHLVQLLSGTISEKTNYPILRKPSDGRTHESDFIGRCLTNVKRLIWDKIHLNTTFHFFEIIFRA